MNKPPHDSAFKHVTGKSVYVDDIPVSGALHGRVVYSPHAHARITRIDTAKAKALPGVLAVLTASDIPGQNQMGPVVHDEPCLAGREVVCIGQAVVLIAAMDEATAREAEKLLVIDYEPLDAVIDLQTAMERNLLLAPARSMHRGNVASALHSAPIRLEGRLTTGAQEHWYLETQTCLCQPGEGKEMNVFSSTQHPSETQAIVAEVLGIAKHEVTVETRRMGGAFGGKETQANHTAAWAALLAHATRQPVKIRLFRDDDQIITGKRHPFIIDYSVGFDPEGRLLALDMTLNSDAGCATDLSMAILERAMLHADNSYYIPDMRVTGRAYRTNLPSNTAFRGFGGPQGMAGIEHIIDRVARFLKADPMKIRELNFYGAKGRDVTHYGQTVEDNRLSVITEQLLASSSYAQRRKAIAGFNNGHEFVKRGIAATPVKFGISFTTTFLNQAGALVNIYTDGTVLVNHGGTEMGQGLNTKIAQIAAAELGVSLWRIKVNATNTSKVPNTSATAASAGTDLNGMAVKDAIDKLKSRLFEFAAAEIDRRAGVAQTSAEDIELKDDRFFDRRNPDRSLEFAEAVRLAWLERISLSATGFYSTPDIGWDKQKGWGRPFNYYAFGMAVSEVEVDMLTGHVRHVRTDILHDVGDSINENIDIGQVEGGFIQGLGWCTTEDIKRDAKGNLLNHSPDTYKIPSVRDIPADLRVNLLQNAPNPRAIRKSKAVAEPPFMLALSTWLAIKDAVSAVCNHDAEPELNLPATNEAILLSIEALKSSGNN
jgi:xanthine dehydrogenase molybdopterin binding subunit